MMKDLPQTPGLDSLNQLSREELVVLVMQQQKIIEQLREEIERLKVSRDLDSQANIVTPIK